MVAIIFVVWLDARRDNDTYYTLVKKYMSSHLCTYKAITAI